MIEYGQRLKALRLGQGVTQSEASRLLGLSHRQSLAAIEAGTRDLSAGELMRAVKAFNVDLSYFSDPHIVVAEAKFCWRRSKGVALAEIHTLEIGFGRVIGAYREIRRGLGRAPTRARHSTGLGKASVKQDAIQAGEILAGLLTSRSTASPAANLAQVIEEEMDVPVLNLDMPKGVSGAACRLHDMDGIAVNRAEVPGRRNFNMAHELFHILTWDDMPPEHVEDAEGMVGAGYAHVEDLADAFASGLLMPEERLEELSGYDRLPSEQEALARWLNGAADAFGVTSMAMATRLRGVNRLEEEKVKGLLKSKRLTHNGAATAPPPPLPFSKLFLGVFCDGMEQGKIPMETAANSIGLDTTSLVQLVRSHGIPHASTGSGKDWDAMRRRASEWSSLADGWDGEGSVAPAPATLAQAIDFAGKAEAGGIAPAVLSLYADGEVEYHWNKGRSSASVAFLSDGNVVAYVRTSAREPAFQLDQPYGDTKELSDLLAALQQAF